MRTGSDRGIRFFDVYFFDPVFIHLFHTQENIVIGDNDLVFLRQMIQKADEITADGIIIIGSKIQIQAFAQILKICGAERDKFTLIQLDQRLLLILVVLVTNFTDDLLKQIFQCDQSGSGAVLIENNGK